MFNLSSRLSSKARKTLWIGLLTISIVLLALTVAIRLFILPDAIDSISYEGSRWSSIRLKLTMEDAITGVYWNHAVALMELDSQLTDKPLDPAMLEKTTYLPGVTDLFYLDFKNKAGISRSQLVPIDTLLYEYRVHKVRAASVYSKSAIAQRMIGGLCKTESFAYEKQIYSVLIRYITDPATSEATQAVGFILDQDWYTQAAVRALDSLARHSMNINFMSPIAGHLDSLTDDPYAGSRGEWKQTLGLLRYDGVSEWWREDVQILDTLWWWGDPKVDILAREMKHNYMSSRDNLIIAASTQFPKYNYPKKVKRLLWRLDRAGVVLIAGLIFLLWRRKRDGDI